MRFQQFRRMIGAHFRCHSIYFFDLTWVKFAAYLLRKLAELE